MEVLALPKSRLSATYKREHNVTNHSVQPKTEKVVYETADDI